MSRVFPDKHFPGALLLTAGLLAGCMTLFLTDDAAAQVTYQPPKPLQALWIQDRFTGDVELVTLPQPDTSLWNAARITHYENSLLEASRPPMGLLQIESLGLELPVYNGTEELQLNLGAGRIPGTGKFHGDGNLGLSSHRDGYFRVLKDIKLGDEIIVRSVHGEEVFVVSSTKIVHKTDHNALQGGDDRMLTLVTCHPFYFVGSAPDRFIVLASPKDPEL